MSTKLTPIVQKAIYLITILVLVVTATFGVAVTPTAASESAKPVESAAESLPERPAATSYTGWNMMAIVSRNGSNCNYPKLVATSSFLDSSPTWVDITGSITGSACPSGNYNIWVLRSNPFDPTNSAYVLTSDGLWYTTTLQNSPPTWTLVLSKADMRSPAATGVSDAVFMQNMVVSTLDNGYVALLATGVSTSPI